MTAVAQAPSYFFCPKCGDMMVCIDRTSDDQRLARRWTCQRCELCFAIKPRFVEAIPLSWPYPEMKP